MNKTGKYVRHGLTHSRARNIWRWMMRRCYDPKTVKYDRWGGRGITVCERWHDLRNFFTDMGHPPPGMTIDRINNDGNYEPSNCRWAAYKQQARNTARNRYLEFRGEKKLLTDWGLQYRINLSTLHHRLSCGWSIEDALTKPVGRWAN